MKTDLRDYSKTMGSEEFTDPLELLKSIAPLLNVKGGILGVNEVTKIVGLMRNSKKLVSRCIYLSVLRMTSTDEVVEKFLAEGGWKITNKWLTDAKESDNEAIVLEILKLLQRLPLKIQHLRENNTPKIVKHYAKSSDSKIKSAASALMNTWMAIIRGSSGAEIEVPKKKKEKKKSKSDKTATQSTKTGSTKSKNENEKGNPVPVLKAPSFAKFRKTGLETEQPPKKKVKGKIPVTGKRNSVDNEKECPVPEKKVKPSVDHKPKKITISEGFMDALNSASNPVPLPAKKIKRKPLKPPTVNAASAPTKPSPNMEYALGDANDFSASELMRKISPKRNESPVPTDPPKPKLNKYGKPKKTVTFQVEERLEMIRYFEVDENERVNVSTQSFKDAQHREMMFERQLLKGKMPLAHEDNSNGGPWRRPPPIDSLEILVVAGCNSVEKDIQTEREKTVLMEIFLSKDMVPESPAEPDPEPYEITQAKIIPFDDENSIIESMEPEVLESDNGNSGDDVIMKNMLSGIQQSGDGDLTAKLKQILQTATAITNSNNDKQTEEPQDAQQMPMNGPAMWGNGGNHQMGNPQMMPMQNMDMNGQNLPMNQPMGFYGAPQMMVPMQEQNFFRPQWGPNPHHNGPPSNRPPLMGLRPGMNGPPFGNQGWNGPRKWRPGGPRPDYRGNWRGRWNDNRRR